MITISTLAITNIIIPIITPITIGITEGGSMENNKYYDG